MNRNTIKPIIKITMKIPNPIPALKTLAIALHEFRVSDNNRSEIIAANFLKLFLEYIALIYLW